MMALEDTAECSADGSHTLGKHNITNTTNANVACSKDGTVAMYCDHDDHWRVKMVTLALAQYGNDQSLPNWQLSQIKCDTFDAGRMCEHRTQGQQHTDGPIKDDQANLCCND